MSKAYIVYESWNICDDASPIKVFLDKDKCEKFVNEKNIDWNKDLEKIERCRTCRQFDRYCESDNVFDLKDLCLDASIEEDRYGLYCENDMSEGNNTANYYSFIEVDLEE